LRIKRLNGAVDLDVIEIAFNDEALTRLSSSGRLSAHSGA